MTWLCDYHLMVYEGRLRPITHLSLQLKVQYGSGNRSCMAERYSTKARAFG